MAAYYVQTNLICILLLIVVYSRLHNKRETLSARRLAFLRLIWFAVLLCVSDLVAWLCNGKQAAGTRFIVELSNILYDCAISWLCFVWYIYVSLRVCEIEHDQRKQFFLSAIPIMLITLVIVTTPFTGFAFTVDENNNYLRGDGIILHWLISWGYLIAAEIRVFLRMRRLTSRAARQKLVPLLWFIAAPAASAILQMIFYGVTTMQCGVTFSIVLMTFEILQEKISRDSLTGLNNRSALESYFSELLLKGKQRITLMIGDVDRFKQINDSLGHLMGDLALKCMADILKSACGRQDRPLFLCRYGGDEFIICLPEGSPEETRKLISDISSCMASFNTGSHNVFTLEMSIGCAEAECTAYEDVEALIRTADEDMYQQKKQKGTAR